MKPTVDRLFMANLITLSRLLLLIMVVAVIYGLPQAWQTLNLLLIPLMFATDGLDGFVARRLNQATPFGALFDIACDRAVELALWAVFVERGVAPTWVLAVFVLRGVITDVIRSRALKKTGTHPLSVTSSRLGAWLVAGRFVRVGYAGLKTLTFSWLALVVAASAPSTLMLSVATILIYATVVVCLMRAVPVIGAAALWRVARV